jgi:hypothetical protein
LFTTSIRSGIFEDFFHSGSCYPTVENGFVKQQNWGYFSGAKIQEKVNGGICQAGGSYEQTPECKEQRYQQKQHNTPHYRIVRNHGRRIRNEQHYRNQKESSKDAQHHGGKA